jgi:hypothetical protein
MALSNTDTVDLVTKPLPGDACKVVLFVVDSEEPTDELQRYQLLIEKLTSYLNHAMSEQFLAEHPGVTPPDILIRVLCKAPPNQAMLNIQQIGAKGDPASRIPVVFEDYTEFLANMR